VKASNWHDLFNAFKNGMKDLEVMYQNIINVAFEQVVTLQQGVETLEAFDYLAKRESIRTAMKKKALDIIALFTVELDKAKFEFDNIKKSPLLLNLPYHHGRLSGQALWVRMLIHRIVKLKEQMDKLYFVDESVKYASFEKFELIYQNFKQFIVSVKLKEWREENKELEDSPVGLGPKCLDIPVLLRVDDNNLEIQRKERILRSKKGHIESHFDRSLEKLMYEAVAWKKMAIFGVVIPNYIEDFTTGYRENLRVLKEYVMLVVRDHNRIIDYMDETESKLFKGHLEQAQRIINPGIVKLKWSSKGILESFVK